MNSLRLLLTGATGYLGRHLCSRLLKDGHQLWALTREKPNNNDTRAIRSLPTEVRSISAGDLDALSRLECDGVLHCATCYGRNGESQREIEETNYYFPKRILEHPTVSSWKFFINCDTALPKEVSPYAYWKKLFSDTLSQNTSTLLKINVSLQSFFGPHDEPTKLIPYLIHQFVSGASEIPLTSGLQERDFIFIDDVTEAFHFLFKALASGETVPSQIEIGTGKAVSIQTLAREIAQEFPQTRTRLLFGKLPNRAFEPARLVADPTWLKSKGWAPQWDLLSGIRESVREERSRRSQNMVRSPL